MSLKLKRVVSIALVLAFAFAMFVSCSVVKDPKDQLVLKIGDKKYYMSDFAEVFGEYMSAYVYEGGEAQFNPDYATQDSAERLKKYNEYVYDRLIEKAVREILVDELKLKDKLNDDDNKAIDELVLEAVKADAKSFEAEVKKESTTLNKLEDRYKDELSDADKEKLANIDTTVEETITANVKAYIENWNKAHESDTSKSGDTTASNDTTTSSDTATSGDTEANVEMTEEKALENLIKEAECETEEDYRKQLKDEAAFDIYFTYYKADEAVKLFKEDKNKPSSDKTEDKETYDEYEKKLREEKTQEYLTTTKIDSYFGEEATIDEKTLKELYEKQLKDFNDKYIPSDKDVEEYEKSVKAVEDAQKKVDETPEGDEDALKANKAALEEAKKAQKANPWTALYNLLSGEIEEGTVVVIPEGYYYVKHILVEKDEEDENDVSTSSDVAGSGDVTPSDDVTASSDVAGSSDVTGSGSVEKTYAQRKAEVEAELTKIKTAATEAEANGTTYDILAEFDKLIEKYGTDPGMKQEPNKTNGYLVGNGSQWVPEFTKASDALFNNGKGKIGTISEAVETTHGTHYIQLVKIAEAKTTTFDEAREQIEKTLRAQKAQERLESEIKKRDITKYTKRITSYGYQYASSLFSQRANGQ